MPPAEPTRAEQPPTEPPPSEEPPLKEGLAEGMYGGPTDSPGAERYQYPLDSEEGRAISALRELKKAGTAPDTLVVQTLDFAKPQFEKAFPKGALDRQLFEEEPASRSSSSLRRRPTEYQDEHRNASSSNGSVRPRHVRDRGDRRLRRGRAAAQPLDEYVAKYKPSWADPELGFAGGEKP